MPKVLILMGSKKDSILMEECSKYLNWFGIESKSMVASAYRDPEIVAELTKNAESNGFDAIIGVAGMAASLPGVIASNTSLPVLGVPIASGMVTGMDALLSIVQMPPGLPVGGMSIGEAGAINAAIMCARIIARYNEDVRRKLSEFKNIGYRI